MSMIDNHVGTLCAAVAVEIRDLRELIDSLAEVLASDGYLARTYTEQLQSFDLIAQRSEEAAALLDRVAQGTCTFEAVDQVRLDIVQDRLRTAMEPM